MTVLMSSFTIATVHQLVIMLLLRHCRLKGAQFKTDWFALGEVMFWLLLSVLTKTREPFTTIVLSFALCVPPTTVSCLLDLSARGEDIRT